MCQAFCQKKIKRDRVSEQKIPKTDYSEIAKCYDRVRSAPYEVWLSKIIEYGQISSVSTALDVGCGTGRYPLNILSLRNCMFCGLEPSVQMLKQAVQKDKARRVLWVCGDGQQLPFRNSLFDCIYMTLVIHHIDDKEMALKEMFRVLKKKGRCVILTNSHSRIKKHVLKEFPRVLG